MTSDRASLPPSTQRLLSFGYTATAALIAWFLLNTPWELPSLNLATVVLAVTALLPMFQWIKRNDDSYPLIETMLVLNLPFYAAPLLLEHRSLGQYPETLLVQAAWCVIAFQLATIAGARLFNRRLHWAQAPIWTEPIIPESRLHLLGIGMALNTAWLLVNSFTALVPLNLMGSLRALFFGLGLISTFTFARLWGEERLHPRGRTWLVINSIVQLALLASSLLLIDALTLSAVGLLGYFSSSRRVPWLLVIGGLAVFTILHNGKSEMRKAYWEEGRPRLTLTGMPAFFTEWFEIGLHKMDESEDDSAALGLFDRASLLQITAYIIARVPDRSPYLNGESYSSIPVQVVPRFFWPNKPSPNDSVKLLSVGLGMVSEREAETTSIGFGMVSESFANFGWIGPIVLGFVLGAFLQLVAHNTAEAAIFSVQGLFRILCLAWCINTEVTAAVWTSSLYQACIAVFAPLLLWHHFGGKETT